MSEIIKDSSIKLFGKTINLLPDDGVSDASVSGQRHSSLATSTSQDNKDEAATSSDIDDETNTYITPETPKKEESNDSNTPEEKPLKTPDKILPCPRCKSMDTKFCYYNNYNVNQPRHFCKNCQRYPTPNRIVVSNSHGPGCLIGPDSGFPIRFYPAITYWTAPLVPSSLGKHSREENGSTLGRIENEKMGQLNGTGLFKAFESKGDRSVDSTTMVRRANPAALSRSINFHERA